MTAIMLVKGLKYTGKDILKMTYYFQNKSIFHIILSWIRLNLKSKMTLEEIKKEDIYELKL